MAATSVTGVGDRGSSHVTLGVSKLIGPKFDKETAESLEGCIEDVDFLIEDVDELKYDVEDLQSQITELNSSLEEANNAIYKSVLFQLFFVVVTILIFIFR